MGPKIVEMSMTAPLQYLLMIVQAIVLHKVSLSIMQNLKTVYSHTLCRWQVFSF